MVLAFPRTAQDETVARDGNADISTPDHFSSLSSPSSVFLSLQTPSLAAANELPEFVAFERPFKYLALVIAEDPLPGGVVIWIMRVAAERNN